MERKTLEYKCREVVCKGYLVHNEIAKEPHPGIILIHAWKGQDDFIKEKAEILAKLGYITFAADIYGEGKLAKDDEEAADLMKSLFIDRQLLRERIVAAYEAFTNHPLVSKKNIGAIGFCFGGMVAIELVRSGLKVASVCVHGVLGNNFGGNHANIIPNAENLKGSLLMLQGHDDPLGTEKDIENLAKEFTDADIDWQIHIYGKAAHAFTNPQAKEPAKGLQFNQTANDRAWKSIRNFFEEKFKS